MSWSIGLIGERGRELHEFLEQTLGAAGRQRSVVVVATSDQPAMLRRRAAYLTLTMAEYLRDQGLKVLCLMDSVTRFAMALREIYLAAGEVPTSRGYPPGVFAELPRLLERAGPGAGAGSITGLFTVLVEGDDTNEPISDTVRGILDGHVVLDRAIAEGGRFPAVDPLRSLSRTAPGCYAPHERELAREARQLMRLHADMAELIRLGAYRSGANAELDRAIAVQPALERILQQDSHERSSVDGSVHGAGGGAGHRPRSVTSHAARDRTAGPSREARAGRAEAVPDRSWRAALAASRDERTAVERRAWPGTPGRLDDIGRSRGSRAASCRPVRTRRQSAGRASKRSRRRERPPGPHCWTRLSRFKTIELADAAICARARRGTVANMPARGRRGRSAARVPCDAGAMDAD